ncbi:MAG: hypothetical protein GWO11_05675 [Desulfuromonadales bacterium]|nr:hypothetical protein [Desulfuromonadales bacterium]NIR33879.1 hypothetical protein [Desulfuromonadales bacterium]NIS40030.1 hypothetical protein [Desulfuromonadales bacterium]
MDDQDKDKNQDQGPETAAGENKETSRFAELDELQAEIQKRIRDNERFLDRFMDENYKDDEDEPDEDDDGEIFEEL